MTVDGMDTPETMAAAFVELVAQLLDEGHPVRFTARGGSMRPFIRDGDVVTVRCYDGKSPRRGDVAAYLTEQKQVRLHRVVGGGARCGWLVRGDAHWCAAERVRSGEVLGRVHTVVRDGKHCRAWCCRGLGVMWQGAVQWWWPVMWRLMRLRRGTRES